MKQWFAIKSRWSKEISASVEIVRCGFNAYLPTIERVRHHNHRMETVTAARFSGYLFAEFDADEDAWGCLRSDDAKRAGIVKVMGDMNGRIIPVPAIAIDAMMGFKPPIVGAPVKHTYEVGQEVNVYIGRETRKAVFIGYDKRRASVRIWIMGAERTIPVALSALEPLEHNTLTRAAS